MFQSQISQTMTTSSSISGRAMSSDRVPPTQRVASPAKAAKDDVAPWAQSRYWMFTLNNPLEVANHLLADGQSVAEHEGIKYDVPKVLTDSKVVKYSIWQMEKGTNGTIHYQGYVVFKGNQRFRAVKAMIPRAHWEVRRGTHEQARDYCSKQDSRLAGPYEFGEHGQQGKRSDLLSIKQAVDSGLNEKQIATNDDLFPQWLKYHTGVTRYMMLKGHNHRNFQTKALVLWGPPGTGKSSWARDFCETNGYSSYWLVKAAVNQTLFWDGYDGQDVVILDEFGRGFIPRDTACRLVDRYPFSVQHKGGSKDFTSKFVIFISNDDPITWWSGIGGLGPMARRLEGEIGEIRYLGTPKVYAREGEPVLASASFVLGNIVPGEKKADEQPRVSPQSPSVPYQPCSQYCCTEASQLRDCTCSELSDGERAAVRAGVVDLTAGSDDDSRANVDEEEEQAMREHLAEYGVDDVSEYIQKLWESDSVAAAYLENLRGSVGGERRVLAELCEMVEDELQKSSDSQEPEDYEPSFKSAKLVSRSRKRGRCPTPEGDDDDGPAGGAQEETPPAQEQPRGSFLRRERFNAYYAEFYRMAFFSYPSTSDTFCSLSQQELAFLWRGAIGFAH